MKYIFRNKEELNIYIQILELAIQEMDLLIKEDKDALVPRMMRGVLAKLKDYVDYKRPTKNGNYNLRFKDYEVIAIALLLTSYSHLNSTDPFVLAILEGFKTSLNKYLLQPINQSTYA